MKTRAMEVQVRISFLLITQLFLRGHRLQNSDFAVFLKMQYHTAISFTSFSKLKRYLEDEFLYFTDGLNKTKKSHNV